MDWLKHFHLFLFDLDGLLVDTEKIHYQAYINMLKRRGFDLSWSFLRFCQVAHFDDNSLKEGVYSLFPGLFEQEPNWENLKKEKNEIFMKLLVSSKINLMPGVKKLLNYLNEHQIKRCIVTNSTKEQTDIIKFKQPLLKTIPYWLTREDYTYPKPNPDGYLRAIKFYSEKNDRIIGFEDSIRGVKALLETPAQPVLIGNFSIDSSKVFHFKTFDDFLENANI